jgi:hypothetical protein
MLFYGLTVLGAMVSLRPKALRLPYYFCMINSALFAWMFQALLHGRTIPSWVDFDR